MTINLAKRRRIILNSEEVKKQLNSANYALFLRVDFKNAER